MFLSGADRSAKLQAKVNKSPVYSYIFGYRGQHSFMDHFLPNTDHIGKIEQNIEYQNQYILLILFRNFSWWWCLILFTYCHSRKKAIRTWWTNEIRFYALANKLCRNWVSISFTSTLNYDYCKYYCYPQL